MVRFCQNVFFNLLSFNCLVIVPVMEFTNPQLARTIHESERKLVVIPEKAIALWLYCTRVTLASLINSEVKEIACRSNLRWIIWFQTSDTFFWNFFSTIIFWFKKYLMNFKFSKFVNSPCQVLFPRFCQVKRQFLRNLVRLKVVCSFILYWGGGGAGGGAPVPSC